MLFGFYDSDRNNVFTSYFDGANLSSTAIYQPRVGYIEELFTNQADYRYQSWWKRNGSYYNFIKYKGITYDKDNVPLYALMVPLMRVSEAYYIAAECLSRRLKMAEAAGYINTILKARGQPELPQDVNYADFNKTLNNEYIREFWGEGQIFFMFKRNFMNITKDYNASATGNVTANNSTYVLPLPSNELENR